MTSVRAGLMLGDVVTEPASIALFNHAIVYVPKYELWLDGTAEYAGRELPLEDQGALTLTVSLSGAAQIRVRLGSFGNGLQGSDNTGRSGADTDALEKATP